MKHIKKIKPKTSGGSESTKEKSRINPIRYVSSCIPVDGNGG